MFRRLLVTVVLAAGLAILEGSAVDAAPPSDDPNCTFDRGVTTCQETSAPVEFTQTEERCEIQDPQGGTMQGVTVTTYRGVTIKTTSYKGRNTGRPPATIFETTLLEVLSSECVVP